MNPRTCFTTAAAEKWLGEKKSERLSVEVKKKIKKNSELVGHIQRSRSLPVLGDSVMLADQQR